MYPYMYKLKLLSSKEHVKIIEYLRSIISSKRDLKIKKKNKEMPLCEKTANDGSEEANTMLTLYSSLHACYNNLDDSEPG